MESPAGTKTLAHQLNDESDAPISWLVWAAAAFIVGIAWGGIDISGAWLGWGLSAAATGLAIIAWAFKNDRAGRACLLIAVAGFGCAWVGVRNEGASDGTAGGSLAAYVHEDGKLAELEGVVAGEPYLSSATKGYFASFAFEPPKTLFELDVSRVIMSEGATPVSGRVLVKIDEADHRIQAGQAVRVRGWLSAFGPRKNVGDFDYRNYQMGRGVVGRLVMPTRNNWEVIESDVNKMGVAESTWSLKRPGHALDDLRGWLAERAQWSLSLGLAGDTQTLGLLQTLLLGETGADIDPLRERFRNVGLAHLLSISGAHLGILMGLVWVLVRFFVDRPSRAAMLVLAVLGMYLLMVPIRVPIARAGVMAGLYFAGVSVGRRPTASGLLSLAAVLVLLWRPSDLFSPGFQLSFVTVWSLLRFVGPVSLWMWPEPVVAEVVPSVGSVVLRRVVDYMAVSLVAFVTSMPLVAYHFGMASPLGLILSVLSLPVLTAVLGVGYAKVLIGLVLPSGSLVLAGPTRWMGRTLVGLVDEANTWPGAVVTLNEPVGVAWVVGATAVAWAWFGGLFNDRRKAGVAAVLVMMAWTVAVQRPSWAGFDGDDEVVATLTMFAVGDGSCYLIEADDRAVMFDCGSQGYPLVGRRSVATSLRKMGVRRLDVLIISHADIDHYNGVIDVLDAVAVDEIWVSRDVVEDAKANPGWATAHLVELLRQRGHELKQVGRGDRVALGELDMQVLWPPGPEQFEAKRSNDKSVVLFATVGGQRLLLNGDIQEAATTQLLTLENDLSAAVTDLPHHGSKVDSSERWLDAVSPRVVLQSSGPDRLRNDKWAEAFADRPSMQRYVTHHDGMMRVELRRDGGLRVEQFIE